MFEAIARWGAWGILWLQCCGRAGIFLAKMTCRKPQWGHTWPIVRQQLFYIGSLSCFIMMVSGLFIGMVVGLQGYHTLEKFGAATHVGQLLALSITRELGPVLCALLFAGRAGSSLTAEIGLMKATEQLDSMDMMAVDPVGYVLYPRFIAGMIALPLLTLIFSAMAIIGGYLISVPWLGIDDGSFWSNMQAAVDFRADVCGGVIKSVVFALSVLWISIVQGFLCEPTAEGICRATTRTVVFSSLSVLGFDVLLTAMMIGG